MFDARKCLICKAPNRTVYWHYDTEKGSKWCFCNKCDRGYSVYQYCNLAGITLKQLLTESVNFDNVQERDNTIERMDWPEQFVSLLSPQAAEGLQYLQEQRGIQLKEADVYYDNIRNGIVFPYYYEKQFAGAQIRFITPRTRSDGKAWKIDTLTGSRLGLLFGLWDQTPFQPEVKAVGVCEGYINALSLQQSFNSMYGGLLKNPWRFVCISGSGGSEYQIGKLQQLKTSGMKVFGALDSDEAGIKGLAKLQKAGALTHYSLTQDDKKDWNDILKSDGEKKLSELFLANVNKITPVAG